jgi:hypothetical protein
VLEQLEPHRPLVIGRNTQLGENRASEVDGREAACGDYVAIGNHRSIHVVLTARVSIRVCGEVAPCIAGVTAVVENTRATERERGGADRRTVRLPQRRSSARACAGSQSANPSTSIR